MNTNPTNYNINIFYKYPNISPADNFQKNYRNLISDIENFLDHAQSKRPEEIERTFKEFQRSANDMMQAAMLFIQQEYPRSLTHWNLQKMSDLIADLGDNTVRIDRIFKELIQRSQPIQETHLEVTSSSQSNSVQSARTIDSKSIELASAWLNNCQNYILELKNIDFSLQDPQIQTAINESHVDFVRQLLTQKRQLMIHLSSFSNTQVKTLATIISASLENHEIRITNAINNYHEILGLPKPLLDLPALEAGAPSLDPTNSDLVWTPAIYISNSLKNAADCYLEGVSFLNSENEFYNVPETYFTKIKNTRSELNEIKELLQPEQTSLNRHVLEIIFKEVELKLTQLSDIENRIQNLSSNQAGSSSSIYARNQQPTQTYEGPPSKTAHGHTSSGAYIFTLTDVVDSITRLGPVLNQINDLVKQYNEKYPEGPLLKIRYIEEAGIIEVNHSAQELVLHFYDPILSPIRKIFFNAKGCVISRPEYFTGATPVSLGYSNEELKRVHDSLPDCSSRINLVSQANLDVRPDEALMDLVNNNAGIVIGEVHSDLTPKDILIRNMQALKQAGVEYLYMEAIPHTMQDALDKWYIEKHPSPLLHRFITSGFAGWHAVWNGEVQQRYLALIHAAIDAGIKVIGIETAGNQMDGHSSGTGSHGSARMLGMNIPAYYTITRYQSLNPRAKFIAFVGSAHASTCNDTKGLRELLGVPAAVISDRQGRSSSAETLVNVTNLGFTDTELRRERLLENGSENKHQVELIVFSGLRSKSFYSYD